VEKDDVLEPVASFDQRRRQVRMIVDERRPAALGN
jgi:hypothetical protein